MLALLIHALIKDVTKLRARQVHVSIFLNKLKYENMITYCAKNSKWAGFTAGMGEEQRQVGVIEEGHCFVSYRPQLDQVFPPAPPWLERPESIDRCSGWHNSESYTLEQTESTWKWRNYLIAATGKFIIQKTTVKFIIQNSCVNQSKEQKL